MKPPQHPPHLWSVGTCEDDELIDPKQQDLHDSGQQDIQQEPWWEPLISGIAEAKGLKPDLWLVTMNTCKINGLKSKVCVSIGCTTAFTMRFLLLFFSFCLVSLVYDFLLKFCFVLFFKAEGRCRCKVRRDKWEQNAWCEIHKNSIKVRRILERNRSQTATF